MAVIDGSPGLSVTVKVDGRSAHEFHTVDCESPLCPKDKNSDLCERPFAVFEFRYRTRDGLVKEGIIPRPSRMAMSAHQKVEEDIGNMSEDEVRERLAVYMQKDEENRKAAENARIASEQQRATREANALQQHTRSGVKTEPRIKRERVRQPQRRVKQEPRIKQEPGSQPPVEEDIEPEESSLAEEKSDSDSDAEQDGLGYSIKREASPPAEDAFMARHKARRRNDSRIKVEQS
ncbi:hypothetical protein C8A01DRAFT_37031 [Parachaetomium inaequale]|uniref:Uncharacterized protein n=1 Tax=Parachaetomium inaequale TaxID=2588326 RepID=A0AAN6PE69_9PEZI|nr:hypothetical protein C8A01DRAFT_37031 [Parachaetomium inaequale]